MHPLLCAVFATQIGTDIRRRGATSSMAALHLQLRRYQTKLLRLTTGRVSASQCCFFVPNAEFLPVAAKPSCPSNA
jgi:hypothetical protein